MDRRVTIRMPGDLAAQLETVAEQRGHKLSHVIRRLIERGLALKRSTSHNGGVASVDAVLRQCGPKVEAWVRSESERLECEPAMVITGALYWAMEEQAGTAWGLAGAKAGGRSLQVTVTSAEAADEERERSRYVKAYDITKRREERVPR